MSRTEVNNPIDNSHSHIPSRDTYTERRDSSIYLNVQIASDWTQQPSLILSIVIILVEMNHFVVV